MGDSFLRYIKAQGDKSCFKHTWTRLKHQKRRAGRSWKMPTASDRTLWRWLLLNWPYGSAMFQGRLLRVISIPAGTGGIAQGKCHYWHSSASKASFNLPAAVWNMMMGIRSLSFGLRGLNWSTLATLVCFPKQSFGLWPFKDIISFSNNYHCQFFFFFCFKLRELRLCCRVKNLAVEKLSSVVEEIYGKEQDRHKKIQRPNWKHRKNNSFPSAIVLMDSSIISIYQCSNLSTTVKWRKSYICQFVNLSVVNCCLSLIWNLLLNFTDATTSYRKEMKGIEPWLVYWLVLQGVGQQLVFVYFCMGFPI